MQAAGQPRGERSEASQDLHAFWLSLNRRAVYGGSAARRVVYVLLCVCRSVWFRTVRSSLAKGRYCSTARIFRGCCTQFCCSAGLHYVFLSLRRGGGVQYPPSPERKTFPRFRFSCPFKIECKNVCVSSCVSCSYPALPSLRLLVCSRFSLYRRTPTILDLPSPSLPPSSSSLPSSFSPAPRGCFCLLAAETRISSVDRSIGVRCQPKKQKKTLGGGVPCRAKSRRRRLFRGTSRITPTQRCGRSRSRGWLRRARGAGRS